MLDALPNEPNMQFNTLREDKYAVIKNRLTIIKLTMDEKYFKCFLGDRHLRHKDFKDRNDYELINEATNFMIKLR